MSSDKWILINEYNYTYDKNTKIRRSKVNDNFYNKKSEYEYDKNGNKISKIIYKTIYKTIYNSKWTFTTKYEYSYNNIGKLDSTIKYEWNPDSNKWVLYNKIKYEYNKEGKKIHELYYKYDSYEYECYDDDESYFR